MPGPESKQPRTFFPTAINAYRQCPERYYHQYIRNRKRPHPFSRPMIAGGATHRLIAAVLPGFMQTGQIPDSLESRALEEVSTTKYPQDELPYREVDAGNVATWTRTAIGMIPAGSTSLLQERNLYAPLGRTGLQIGARVDLVLERPGGMIEHIDFKTGKIRDNTVQSLMARAVVGRRFKRREHIQTTTIYLQHRRRDSLEMERESSQADWQAIARDIRNIRTSRDFPPRPGPLCEYCPYQARDCSVW